MPVPEASEFCDCNRPFAVFGGGHWRQGDEEWHLGVEVGGAIADEGFTVATGGYSGAMEAVSEGALAAGGTVAGVVHRPVDDMPPNRHVQQVIRAGDYLERLAILSRVPHAMALPGGSGTLAELTVGLALLRRYPDRTLAVWAPFWRHRLASLLTELDREALARITWVDSLDTVRFHLHSIRSSRAPTT